VCRIAFQAQRVFSPVSVRLKTGRTDILRKSFVISNRSSLTYDCWQLEKVHNKDQGVLRRYSISWHARMKISKMWLQHCFILWFPFMMIELDCNLPWSHQTNTREQLKWFKLRSFCKTYQLCSLFHSSTHHLRMVIYLCQFFVTKTRGDFYVFPTVMRQAFNIFLVCVSERLNFTDSRKSSKESWIALKSNPASPFSCKHPATQRVKGNRSWLTAALIHYYGHTRKR